MPEPSAPQLRPELLLAWLRSDARLGIAHWAVMPTRRVSAAARSAAGAASVRDERAAERSASALSAPRPAGVAVAPAPAGRSALALPVAPEGAVADPAGELATLDASFVRGCVRCGLHAQRTQTVFGVGDPRAALVFVGEGPGADEDLQGKPFVGRAGQLLTRMIAAMSLTREQVYICNVVKCRPPGNRTPSDDEMATCSPFLFRQLAVIRPRVIVALGRPATQTLLASRAPISALRGRFHDFPPPALADHGLPPARLMPTFHPAYLLRSPGEKGKTWDDLKQVMAFLGIPVPP
ncbi:MAG: hypothetical protein CHACPFDD_02051 [Phycisphaerae bacterium]|nr:hypothetical protein [Phycisphaerae bacterium]